MFSQLASNLVFLPLSLLETTIVFVIKNACGRLTESNNYRPIAIATITSKLLECVDYYKKRNTTVCVTFPDACKHLIELIIRCFSNLINKNLLLFIVKLFFSGIQNKKYK